MSFAEIFLSFFFFFFFLSLKIKLDFLFRLETIWRKYQTFLWKKRFKKKTNKKNIVHCYRSSKNVITRDDHSDDFCYFYTKTDLVSTLLNRLSVVFIYLNPGPADPGYTLFLQTVYIQIGWLLKKGSCQFLVKECTQILVNCLED